MTARHEDGYDWAEEAEARAEARSVSAETAEAAYGDWVFREPA